MANIKLQDLTSITEASLFSNSEGFIQELSSESELTLQGGGFFKFLPKKPKPTSQPQPNHVVPDISPFSIF